MPTVSTTIWMPRNASETAPRIRLDKIIATDWIRNGTSQDLQVNLDGGHMITLTAHEGNQLLDAWDKFMHDRERVDLMRQRYFGEPSPK